MEDSYYFLGAENMALMKKFSGERNTKRRGGASKGVCVSAHSVVVCPHLG